MEEKEILVQVLLQRSKDLLIDEIGKKVFGEDEYKEVQEKIAKQVIEEFKDIKKDE